MSNPTTPFSWQMPTNTDLVTDLPADFEVFGQAVATSMADLLGGTSGQILAKNSNTDMDFVWIANDQGDITGITATSPLTGGGTSGAITVGIQSASTTQSGAVQLSDSTSTTSSVLAATPTAVKSSYDLAAAAIPKSTVTTNGDLIYGTGSSAVTRLGVGSTGNVLTVSDGVPTWAAPAGGGKVLQVVTVNPSTSFTTTSATFVDATSFSASITPTLNTSKILVLFDFQGGVYGSGNSNQYSSMQVLRGSTVLLEAGVLFGIALGSSQNIELFGRSSFITLDSPATTSSTTYKLQIKRDAGTAAAQKPSSIVLMEIGA